MGMSWEQEKDFLRKLLISYAEKMEGFGNKLRNAARFWERDEDFDFVEEVLEDFIKDFEIIPQLEGVQRELKKIKRKKEENRYRMASNQEEIKMSKRELHKISREIREIKRKLAGKDSLDVFGTLGVLSPSQLEKAAQKAWPNVTYKGEDIVKFITKMDRKIQKDFVSDFWQDYDDMQEVYLGYDAKKDIMYMGFDVEKTEVETEYEYEYDEFDEEVENEVEVENFYFGWALFEIKNGKVKEVDSRLRLEGSGFYGGGGLKTVKSMGLSGLRYD